MINITPKRLRFLNELNEYLTLKEKEILVEATLLMHEIKNRAKENSLFTSDLELDVEVSYFTRNTDGDPIYTTNHCIINFKIENKTVKMLSNDIEDWYEEGWWFPKMQNNCCYLMHDLVYHSKLYKEIFRIDCVWVDMRLWKQNCSKLKNNSWKTY
jgi:hypothetical protein